MPSIKHTSPLLRYGVAVLAVGVAFGLKLLLAPLIVQDTPFLLIFAAIMISAWYGGLGPGLLATFTGGLAADYFFLPPTGSLSGFSLETVPLLVFFLEGTLVCLLVEALRGTRARAEGVVRWKPSAKGNACAGTRNTSARWWKACETTRSSRSTRRDASPAGTRVLNVSKATTLRRSSESGSPCSSPKKTSGWASPRNTSRRRRARAAP